MPCSLRAQTITKIGVKTYENGVDHAGTVGPIPDRFNRLRKNYKILTVDFQKNKESKKINGAQFRARMRENRPKQCNAFIE